MKKVIFIAILIAMFVSTADANYFELQNHQRGVQGAIDSGEAVAINSDTESIFNAYGLIVENTNIQFRNNGDARLFFYLHNSSAKYRLVSKRRYRDSGSYDRDGDNFIYSKEEKELTEFKPIIKEVERGWFGDKEVLAEIQDLYENIPTWGMEYYQVVIEISFFRKAKVIIYVSPEEISRDEFLVRYEKYMNNEELECIKILKEAIKEILQYQ